jgi:hypothetical protein
MRPDPVCPCVRWGRREPWCEAVGPPVRLEGTAILCLSPTFPASPPPSKGRALADGPLIHSAATLRLITSSLGDQRQKPSDGNGYDEMAQILWQTSAHDPARSCHWN